MTDVETVRDHQTREAGGVGVVALGAGELMVAVFGGGAVDGHPPVVPIFILPGFNVVGQTGTNSGVFQIHFNTVARVAGGRPEAVDICRILLLHHPRGARPLAVA